MLRFSRRLLSNALFAAALFVLTWVAGLTGSVIYGEVLGLPRVSPPPAEAGLHMTLSEVSPP